MGGKLVSRSTEPGRPMSKHRTSAKPTDTPPAALLEALAGTLDRSAEALRQEDPGRRAAGVAAALRALWPSSPLSLCLLRSAGGSHLAALDAGGQAAPHGTPADGSLGQAGP